MAGLRFETFIDVGGQHRFRIRGPNGEPLAASEGYRNRSDMLHTVRLIQAKAAIADIVDNTAHTELPDDDDLRQNC